jgi:histidinol dehydrogenase
LRIAVLLQVMENTAEMFELMNDVAPEHLEVQLENPTQYLGLIKNAGSVFLGRYASEPLGDYVAGPNPRAANWWNSTLCFTVGGL